MISGNINDLEKGKFRESTDGEVAVATERGTTPQVYNVSLTANTEESLELPSNTVVIDIKLRAVGSELKVYWESEASEYMTVPVGGSLRIDGVKLTGKTIYLKTSGSGQVAEVQVFTV